MSYKASFAERLAIHEFLKGVIRRNADGTVTYTNDFTDEKVADTLSVNRDRPIKERSVAGVRNEMFGPVRRISSPYDRLAELESRIAALEERLK